MEYRATFREIHDMDVGKDCPTMPDPEEFTLHLDEILQDIGEIEGVSHTLLSTDRVLSIKADLDLKELKLRVRPILQNHFEYARAVALEAI